MAGGGIANSGTTIVSGDIGTYPSLSYVGSATDSQTGVNHLGDSVTQIAKADLLTAVTAAGTGPATGTMTGDLGGLTLGPGIYKGNTSNYTITINGILTLDGGNDPNAVFIFRGTILSELDITLKPNASVLGRLLSTNGKITIEKNYIYKPTCGTPPTVTPTGLQVPIKPIGFVATVGGTPLMFSAALVPVLLVRSVPLSISIPAIGVKAKIVTLGFDSEGGMEVPTTGVVTCWFNGAPIPGELGPAIIVGHIDHVGLRLITCGGRFDSKLKRNVDNFIVFAKAT